jgi:outer membrane protein OmpA-like peptidoglycan-associated protein
MMKHLFISMLLLLFLVPVEAQQRSDTVRTSPTVKSQAVRYHAFSGAVHLGVDGGMSLGFTDYTVIKPEVLGRANIEYFFPTTTSGIFGLRGFFTFGYVGGKAQSDFAVPQAFKTPLNTFGGGISYHFSVQETVFPYLFAGASYTLINPKDPAGVELPYPPELRTFKTDELNFHVEAGIRFLVAADLSLNLSAGAQLSTNDNWDAQPRRGANDWMLHIMGGLSYSLFGDRDSDGDGVPDRRDQCPDTPPGVKVDAFGCPIDSDGDGIPDYLDKCPNTRRGLEVDEHGCPRDSDGDGVPDERDKCPNTPKGMPVNDDGCPDSDGDGVPDNLDKCPNTPKGAPVDEHGCPRDSDGDGVPDYLDQCPNTPKGEQVDERGCSTQRDTVVIQKQIVLRGDTNFEFNKAELLPAAHSVLDQAAKVMADHPKTRWRVEGHTDAIGSEQYNMELSRRRAESVVNYLASKGIDRNRLDIIPLGKSQPVATNDTQEGRAMNRRVEIELIE